MKEIIDLFKRNDDQDKKEMRRLHFFMMLLIKDDIVLDIGNLSIYRYVDRLTMIIILRKFYSLKKMQYNIKTGILLEESK